MIGKNKEAWNQQFKEKARELYPPTDPAHDLLHVMRVVQQAEHLCLLEKAQWEVVAPAAWFHDFVTIPKNDLRRAQASRLSAEAAIDYLNSISYPSRFFPEIAHAIEAHSFSANVAVKSLEAGVVQDADRLDGLGAVGIARCFATGGLLKVSFYHEGDPWAEGRALDDRSYSLDHFYQKLLKLADSMVTQSGKTEALRRIRFMETFLESFRTEIGAKEGAAIF